MLLKRRSAHHLTEQDVTPEAVYQDRRLILKGLGLGAATLAFPTQAGVLDLWRQAGAGRYPGAQHPRRYPVGGVILTPEEKATTHNNFYELGTDKGIRPATATTSSPSPGP